MSVHTVEKRIVCYPDASTKQDQSSNTTKETFWRPASGASETLRPSCEFILDACPGFFRVGCGHCGGM